MGVSGGSDVLTVAFVKRHTTIAIEREIYDVVWIPRRVHIKKNSNGFTRFPDLKICEIKSV
jgi:hypothetical protein